MITKEKISAGLKERIVTLEVDPNMGSGTGSAVFLFLSC